MSRFGELIRTLRKGRGLTLEAVARAIGSNKGYVSGIETGKVNPPSAKVIRKLAKMFGQDDRSLLLMAWMDKAPEIIRRDLLRGSTLPTLTPSSDEHVRIPLLNGPGTGYPLDVDDHGRIQPLVHAALELPRTITAPLDAALIIQEASMAHPGRAGLNPGDIALLRHEPQILSGADAFLILDGIGSMVRHVVVERGNRVVLQARNPNHPRKVVRKADVKAFYHVAGRICFADH